MARMAFEKGDVVGYPDIYTPCPGERTVTVLDRQIVRHRSGALYIRYLLDDLLDRLVEDMKENIANEYDNVVIVTGKEGVGKSNLAYELCHRFDQNFSMEDGYIYDFEPFLERLESGEDMGRTFWMDEATNLMSNRDWMKDDNRSMMQILEMMRSRKWTLVMCIPSIDRADVYVREFRLRYLLVAQEIKWDSSGEAKRGFFELKIPTNNGFTTVGYGKFPRMNPEILAEYSEIKSRSQERKISEIAERAREKKTRRETKRNTDALRALVTMLHDEQGLKFREISEITGLPEGTLRRMATEYREAME